MPCATTRRHVLLDCCHRKKFLSRHLVEAINKKNKNAKVKDFMVKNHLWVFVNCQIENPAFDSQVLPTVASLPCVCGTEALSLRAVL